MSTRFWTMDQLEDGLAFHKDFVCYGKFITVRIQQASIGESCEVLYGIHREYSINYYDVPSTVFEVLWRTLANEGLTTPQILDIHTTMVMAETDQLDAWHTPLLVDDVLYYNTSDSDYLQCVCVQKDRIDVYDMDLRYVLWPDEENPATASDDLMCISRTDELQAEVYQRLLLEDLI